MAKQEEEMYFFIGDISGYTNFMLKHDTCFSHATLIVMQLMEALIKEAKFPIEISKLEGDAIFMYLRKSRLPKKYIENPRLLGEKLLDFFRSFHAKLGDLVSATTCHCGGCANLHELRLKMVVHYGHAALAQIGSFKELSGIDVIIPHRLLKNTVKSKCYLLMTDSAYNKKLLSANQQVEQSMEQDKDLGTIATYIYYPTSDVVEKEASTFNKKLHNMLMNWSEKRLKWGLVKKPKFGNLPSA